MLTPSSALFSQLRKGERKPLRVGPVKSKGKHPTMFSLVVGKKEGNKFFQARNVVKFEERKALNGMEFEKGGGTNEKRIVF